MNIFGKNYLFGGKKRPNKGFTLIELMAVVTIISIVTIFTVANYRSGNVQAALEMEANQLAQNGRRVQEWALAAHNISGVARPGYGLYLDPGQNGRYILYAEAVGAVNGRYDAGTDDIQETVTLNSNIEIAACAPGPVSVNYAPPDPTTIMDASGAQSDKVLVTLRIKNTSITRTVVLNRAGLIYVD